MERGGDEITEHDEITRKYSTVSLGYFSVCVCLYLCMYELQNRKG